jgi:hypothetical protein
MIRPFSNIWHISFHVSGSRASRVHASTPLELLFAEIPKLLSTPPLDPMVKFLSYDLRCRSFHNFGFRYFATCETRFFTFGFLGVETSSGNHVFSPMDSPGEFGISCIVISMFLCNSKGFLNPVHIFQI